MAGELKVSEETTTKVFDQITVTKIGNYCFLLNHFKTEQNTEILTKVSKNISYMMLVDKPA